MIRMEYTLEDTKVFATLGSDGWVLEIEGFCSVSNTVIKEKITVTDEEFCAIITLANGVGEEEFQGYNIPYLYTIVEPVFATVNPVCRFIP